MIYSVPIFLVTIAEVLVSISGLNFVYEEVRQVCTAHFNLGRKKNQIFVQRTLALYIGIWKSFGKCIVEQLPTWYKAIYQKQSRI
jgi:hypothetical protein